MQIVSVMSSTQDGEFSIDDLGKVPDKTDQNPTTESEADSVSMEQAMCLLVELPYLDPSFACKLMSDEQIRKRNHHICLAYAKRIFLHVDIWKINTQTQTARLHLSNGRSRYRMHKLIEKSSL